jgi:hypothetical protein
MLGEGAFGKVYKVHKKTPSTNKESTGKSLQKSITIDSKKSKGSN